ncbi:hypothetical protein Emag_004172 [Eimeria magna]
MKVFMSFPSFVLFSRKAMKITSGFLHHCQKPFACSSGNQFQATPSAAEFKREDGALLDFSCISGRDQQVYNASAQESICTKREDRQCSIEEHSVRRVCSSGSAAGRASHRTPVVDNAPSRCKASLGVASSASRRSCQKADKAANAPREYDSAGAAPAECITVFDSSSDGCSSDCRPLSMVVKEKKACREDSAALGAKKREHQRQSLVRRKRKDVPHETAQTNEFLTFQGCTARRANRERHHQQRMASRVSRCSVHEAAQQRSQGAAKPPSSPQVRGSHAAQGETVGILHEVASLASIRSHGSTLEGAGDGVQRNRRRPQLSLSQEQVSSHTSTRGTSQGWPECVRDMLGPDIFSRVKEQPELILAVSEGSGMTVFHHMLRHEDRDDEQMLDLFRCIYEDAALRERVPLPRLTELKCSQGQTLAFYAAAYGHVNCLKWILQQAGQLWESFNMAARILHHQ